MSLHCMLVHLRLMKDRKEGWSADSVPTINENNLGSDTNYCQFVIFLWPERRVHKKWHGFESSRAGHWVVVCTTNVLSTRELFVPIHPVHYYLHARIDRSLIWSFLRVEFMRRPIGTDADGGLGLFGWLVVTEWPDPSDQFELRSKSGVPTSDCVSCQG